MKKIKYFLSAIFLVIFAMSCSESDLPNKEVSAIKVDDNEKSQFDKFLYKKFVEPYNIELLYKWKDVEADMNYALVPANYANSVKMANLVQYLCLEPFDKVAPKNFMKKYFPKMLMLVGSAGYRNNGTKVLGTAEGGLKITLYEINNLDVTNIDNLNELYFRTIYHEFSHILHQNKIFSVDFDKITATQYKGGSWNESWKSKEHPERPPSNEAGFISDYASKEPNEDFVEIIAHYITNSKEKWNEKIVAAGSVGGPLIEQKTAIVKSYLKNVWSIDIDELRKEIQLRANKLDEQDLDNINF